MKILSKNLNRNLKKNIDIYHFNYFQFSQRRMNLNSRLARPSKISEKNLIFKK